MIHYQSTQFLDIGGTGIATGTMLGLSTSVIASILFKYQEAETEKQSSE